jgi:hypothetical protein
MLNCPGLAERLKRAIAAVRKIHSLQCASLVFGSQRRFFNRVFARLKQVPVDPSLLIQHDETLPQSDKAEFSKTLRDCFFMYRKAKTWSTPDATEYWQCMQCRMVPFEYRAAGSLFFTRPQIEDLKRHAKMCQKDGICWDAIQLAMKNLNEKYSLKSPLIERESFSELMSTVLGKDSEVIDVFMAGLGKASGSQIPSSSNLLWHRLPSMVDVEKLDNAFMKLKDDLNLESPNLRAAEDFVEFLELLQCNFRLPPSEQRDKKEDSLQAESATLSSTRDAQSLYEENDTQGATRDAQRLCEENDTLGEPSRYPVEGLSDLSPRSPSSTRDKDEGKTYKDKISDASSLPFKGQFEDANP